MKQITQLSLLTIAFTVVFSSCKDPIDRINNPSMYDFTRNNESTVSFGGQTTRIGMATELIDGMNSFSQTSETLLEMFTNQAADGSETNPFSNPDYNESTKNIQSKVAASADFFESNTAESALIKNTFKTWIESHFIEVFPNQNELAESGKAGQIADETSTRYVNAKGLEYNQAVNKSLIGALMVDQICNHYLSTSVLDAGSNIADNDNNVVVTAKPYTDMEHKWDEAYGYLFGASSDPENPLVNLEQDAFLNKYLGKVSTDPDFASIDDKIWEAFKLGRAAIVAKEYEIRDEQADIIKNELSKLIAVRAVYYLQQAKFGLPANGTVFHDLSEGFGFIYSLRFTKKSNNESYFTRDEVDTFTNKLLAGNGFWDVDAELLDQISESIASKFDFTIEEAAN